MGRRSQRRTAASAARRSPGSTGGTPAAFAGGSTTGQRATTSSRPQTTTPTPNAPGSAEVTRLPGPVLRPAQLIRPGTGRVLVPAERAQVISSLEGAGGGAGNASGFDTCPVEGGEHAGTVVFASGDGRSVGVEEGDGVVGAGAVGGVFGVGGFAAVGGHVAGTPSGQSAYVIRRSYEPHSHAQL